MSNVKTRPLLRDLRRNLYFIDRGVSGQDPRRHQTENGYGCGEEAEQVDQEHLDPRSACLNRPKTVARLLFVILTGLDVVTGCATEKKQSLFSR